MRRETSAQCYSRTVHGPSDAKLTRWKKPDEEKIEGRRRGDEMRWLDGYDSMDMR